MSTLHGRDAGPGDAGPGRRGADTPLRRQLAGAAELATALAAGAPVRVVLLARSASPAACALAEQARAAGARVLPASDNDLRRMARAGAPAGVELLALVGPDPAAGPEAALAGDGAAWLLAGVAYAGNAGYAIRTAEVSGADAIFLDAALDGEGRRRALRASMHAERFFPVHWAPADEVVAAARAAGRRVIAIEDVGRRAPWEVDLRGRVLFVIGGERHGLDPALLARCDEVVRVPMAGFVPSYNLQAAMAAVAVERLRQLGIG
ncbi:MAG TPA: TrmH family RNA methyltransferase [Myxococcota bacterium]